jgi:hypothetical protein
MPHDDVVILLEGGHKTFVTNTTVGEIERAISDARTAEHSSLTGVPTLALWTRTRSSAS